MFENHVHNLYAIIFIQIGNLYLHVTHHLNKIKYYSHHIPVCFDTTMLFSGCKNQD